MNRITLLILSFIFISFKSFAQDPPLYIKWSKNYGGSQNDDLIKIINAQNGFLLAGNTNSDDGDISDYYGNRDVWIVQIDSLGNIIWEKTFGSNEDEQLNDIIKVENDSYLLTIARGWDEYLVIRIDNVGNIIWEKTFSGFNTSSSKMYCKKISNNNFFIASSKESKFWLCKIDNLGNILWEKYFGETNSICKLNNIVVTNNFEFLLGGLIISIAEDDYDSGNFFLVKIDSSGTFLRKKTYGGSEYDELKIINIDSNNEILLGGHTYSNDGDIKSGNKGQQDIWLVKTDINGNIIWEKTLGGDKNDFISTINNYNGLNTIVGGYSSSHDGDFESEDQGNLDYKLLDINPSGNIIWYRSYGGVFNDYLNSVLVIDNNEIIIGGSSLSDNGIALFNNHGGKDFWVIKVGPNVPPTDLIISDSVVKEKDIGNQLVGIITPVDEDIVDMYEYEIISDDDDINNTFFLTGNILVTKENAPIDYDSRNNYLITIQTEDREGNTFRKQFNIKVINNEFELDYSFLRHPSCPDNSNGSIEVGLKGYVPPLTLSWYYYDDYNWIPTGDSDLFIDNLSPGFYMVEATDSTGGTMQFPFTLNHGMPFNETNICYITSNGLYNEIHIDKGVGNYNVEKYLIYREGISAYNYEIVGEMKATDNHFIDTLVNNRTQSYSYRVSMVDSCGKESYLSSNHNTIHLSQNRGTSGEVNLYWTPYMGIAIPTYSIYRQKENDEFELIKQVSSNNSTYTDFTSNPSFNYQYYISFPLTDTCYTDVNLKSEGVTEVKSNVVSTDINYTGIKELANDIINVFPNPVSEKFVIETIYPHPLNFTLTDISGNTILRKNLFNPKNEIYVNKLASGFYFLTIFDENTILHKQKIIKK